MKNKLVPEPTPPVPEKRFVLNIGRQKVAFDFGVKATELKPQPAEVVRTIGRRPALETHSRE